MGSVAYLLEEEHVDRQTLHDALRTLAANYRWTWTPSTRELLESLPGGRSDRHPVETVAALSEDDLGALSVNEDLVAWAGAEFAALQSDTEGITAPEIAYCSPEFGLTALLPQYSGGLGVLAGDHLKASSEDRLPLAGVGLFYRQGFFRQEIVDGVQTDHYVELEPSDLGGTDTGEVVSIPMPGRDVDARVWRFDVGSVPLLLLDTDLDTNSEEDRAITDRLYSGDRRHRLEQEMVLGVGGSRALRAMNWDVPLYHLNEGHAGFVTLDLIDTEIIDGDINAAVAALKPRMVFTTHTPVPAGIDRFHQDLIIPYLEVWAARWNVDVVDLWSLGVDPAQDDQFNMAALALRLCRSANGVSRLHGEVSRDLFAGIGVGDAITHVTNGVHARTWVGDGAQRLYDSVAGPAWSIGDADAWEAIATMGDEDLHRMRVEASRNLAELVTASTGHKLDPGSLVIGFARRFAPYKRATLVLEQMERLNALLDDDSLPVHFVFAGKAHPSDEPGKALLARIVEFSNQRGESGRFTFLPGYDMSIARTLVEGADVWLNNPIRPREASGTSGEKSALNGGLNCSILDGWWAEMYDGENGWAIPESESDEGRDEFESIAALDLIEAITTEYHNDRHRFTTRIRHNWKTLGPKVTAARMLSDYNRGIYTRGVS